MVEDFGLGGLSSSASQDPKVTPEFTDDNISKLIKEAEESSNTASSDYNCAVLGKDGTGKSGLVLEYCSKLPKKTLVIDLDGGDMPLKLKHYKDNPRIIILCPLIQESGEEVKINYKKTMSLIRGSIKHVNDHAQEFSAIVLDGLSTLLLHAEYQMRIEKNINVDGGVNQRYWVNRMKMFVETLEAMKAIPGIDKFYIGHEDFIVLDESAAVKKKANQMIHQRIICVKKQDPVTGTVFIAKIDKSKYNILKEGQEIEFASVSGGKFTWNGAKVFEGLK